MTEGPARTEWPRNRPASAAAKALPKYSDRFTEANWLWQECPGDHNFDIWYLGLFNFLKLLGSMQE